MRQFCLLLAAAAVFAFQGCMPENPAGPETRIQAEQNVKSWIAVADFSLDKDVVVSGVVDGAAGGQILYNINLANIYVKGSLQVPENAFEGTLELSALFSNRTTTQVFGPSPLDFSKPLLLTLEYRGVNLNQVNPDEVDFYYIGSDNQLYKAEYSSIVVDVSQGMLKVVDAKLNHFSRWGWAK